MITPLLAAANSMHTPVLGTLIALYILAIAFLGWRGWKKTTTLIKKLDD